MLFAHARLTLVASSATLLALLFCSAQLLAQDPATPADAPGGLAAQCREASQKLGDQANILLADYAAEARVRDRLNNLHLTLKGYAARLQTNPDQFDQIIRAMLVVLSQIKSAQLELKPMLARSEDDRAQQQVLGSAVSDCYERLSRERNQLQPGEQDPAHPPTVLVLSVLDRNETVSLSFSHGELAHVWRLTGRSRQGVTLPSQDPAASDTASPVKVDRMVTASVQVTPPLASDWQLTLGIGADGSTAAGAQNACTSKSGCQATSGPYPGVRRGLGKGWAASEAVEVWICPSNIASCVGQGDPVATVNINWIP